MKAENIVWEVSGVWWVYNLSNLHWKVSQDYQNQRFLYLERLQTKKLNKFANL